MFPEIMAVEGSRSLAAPVGGDLVTRCGVPSYGRGGAKRLLHPVRGQDLVGSLSTGGMVWEKLSTDFIGRDIFGRITAMVWG